MVSLGKSCAMTSTWKPDAQFFLTRNYMLKSQMLDQKFEEFGYGILDQYLINSHEDRRQSMYVFNLLHISSFRNHEWHKCYQHNAVIQTSA